MEKISWELKNKKLSDLKPYEHNPRIIKGKKFDDLKESIARFGVAEPIVINTDGVIIGGHGRYYACIAAEFEFVDCYIPSRTLNDKEVAELNIRLNKNIAGEWDFEILGNAFDMAELKEWGFDDNEFGSFGEGKKEQQGKLDETEMIDKQLTCPECGHIWEYQKKIKT